MCLMERYSDVLVDHTLSSEGLLGTPFWMGELEEVSQLGTLSPHILDNPTKSKPRTYHYQRIYPMYNTVLEQHN